MTRSAVGPSLVPSALALLLASPAWANDPPQLPPGAIDPGAQRERETREFLERERESERDEAVEDPVDGPEGPRGGNLPEAEDEFTLAGIRFSDSVFLDEAFLRSVADEYVERPVTFSKLNRMLDRINTRYRERGLITAAAYIPPQTIEDGILRVELLEGRLGRFRIEGTSYTDTDYLRGRLPVREGEVIDVPALRRSINMLNQHTPLSLRAGIEPGKQTGESDIAITVAEPPRYGVQTFIDNNGSTNTGEWRGGLVGTVNGPLGRADRFTAYGVFSEGSSNGLVRYELPINRYGGRLDLSYSAGEIEVIDGPFADIDITGDSTETSIGYRQPVYSGEYGAAIASAGYGVSESTSEIAGTVISDFTIDEADLRLEWSGGGTATRWRISQGVRYAEVEALDAPSETFTRYPGDASWLRRLDAAWSARVRLGWQWAGDESLPSSLVYQLGGSATVRGYEEGVSSGDEGYLLSAGVDYLWEPALRQTVFVDHGEVDQGASGTDRLTSVGTGFTWRATGDVSVEATVGFPLEDVTPDQDDARAHLRLTWRLPVAQ
jgi:hemolysin activation/secretion protein